MAHKAYPDGLRKLAEELQASLKQQMKAASDPEVEKMDNGTSPVSEGEHARELDKHLKAGPLGAVDNSLSAAPPRDINSVASANQTEAKATGTDPANEKPHDTQPPIEDLSHDLNKMSWGQKGAALVKVSNEILISMQGSLVPAMQAGFQAGKSAAAGAATAPTEVPVSGRYSKAAEFEQAVIESVATRIKRASIAADLVANYYDNLPALLQKRAEPLLGGEPGAGPPMPGGGPPVVGNGAPPPPVPGGGMSPDELQMLLAILQQSQGGGAGGGGMPPAPAPEAPPEEPPAEGGKGEGEEGGSSDSETSGGEGDPVDATNAAMVDKGVTPEMLAAMQAKGASYGNGKINFIKLAAAVVDRREKGFTYEPFDKAAARNPKHAEIRRQAGIMLAELSRK